ncbi:hypothetical protein PIB30_033327 [Stylosanthes scabra]|uniref:Pentatricopeptide repeat-containing protein n=1 Tax=Stylosanthes scabra TaxID=79078 RepID=A0ABU6UDT2_9FABA|nr:hypothetical protein [Stylosanthes scabra]
MLQRGLHPNNITFSNLINCSGMCALPDKAVKWFENMIGMLGNYDGCLSVYQEMKELGVRPIMGLCVSWLSIHHLSMDFDEESIIPCFDTDNSSTFYNESLTFNEDVSRSLWVMLLCIATNNTLD